MLISAEPKHNASTTVRSAIENHGPIFIVRGDGPSGIDVECDHNCPISGWKGHLPYAEVLMEKVS